MEVTEAPVKEETGSVEDILQVFRIFKLARVLKLARHSPGLQVDYQSQGYNARKVICSCVHIKTSSLWAEFVNKNRCMSVRLVSEEDKSI